MQAAPALRERTSPMLAICSPLGAKCTESCRRPVVRSREEPTVGSSCSSTGDMSPKSSLWKGPGSSKRESTSCVNPPRKSVCSPGFRRRAARCSPWSSPAPSVSSLRNCSRACQRSWAETLSMAMSAAHMNSSLPTPVPFVSRSISRSNGNERLLILASMRAEHTLREVSPILMIANMNPETAHMTKPRVRPRLSWLSIASPSTKVKSP
mmetsp:Transcript_48034/g.139124  ORF Transcript_48034/g.139124 Transcript_48034/m.139124 type:complete len:209 (+) Transcript_48034:1084-1710(+)